jgi:tetratricopeptide (TPR) repeat protein
MKSTVCFQRDLAEARQQWREGAFDRALKIVSQLLEDEPANPVLRVMRANLIQLQMREEDEPLTLDDAKKDLLRARAIDVESPVPLIELAYLVFAFGDDARAASRYFQQAIERCRELLKSALLGRAEALAELERNDEAIDCLSEALWLVSYNGKAGREEVLERLRSVQASH